MSRTTRALFILLALLAIGQIGWWAHLIISLDSSYKTMIVAEGIFFLFVWSTSIALVYRSYKKDLELRQSQNDFLSAITHELKTPLASIRLCLDSLDRVGLNEDKRKTFVLRAQDSVTRLLKEIEGLLIISGQDSAKSGEIQSLSQICQHAILSRDKDDQQRVEFVNSQEDFIIHHPREMELIVKSLLDNALQYSSPEKVKVIINSKQRSIEIIDKGIGLTKEEVEHAFDKFYRGSESRKKVAAGTGMGLALSKRLAERAGYRLSLESSGRGLGTKAIVVVHS